MTHKNTNLFTGINILLAIKSLVLVLFIIMLIHSCYGIQNDYWLANNYDGSFNFELLIDRMIFRAYVLPILIILLPVIGIFIKNKAGWVLLTSYFYFLVFNGAFRLKMGELMPSIFFVLLGILLFLAAIIFLMNLKTIRNDIYKISKSQQIMHNIFATIVGIIITLGVAIIHNYPPS